MNRAGKYRGSHHREVGCGGPCGQFNKFALTFDVGDWPISRMRIRFEAGAAEDRDVSRLAIGRSISGCTAVEKAWLVDEIAEPK